MYTNITKKIDNRTLQTREIKKFPLFIEHTSYAKILSELLATTEQYRTSLKRNAMVVNEQFIRRRHLWQPAPVTG